jgi:hypothetical protein
MRHVAFDGRLAKSAFLADSLSGNSLRNRCKLSDLTVHSLSESPGNRMQSDGIREPASPHKQHESGT